MAPFVLPLPPNANHYRVPSPHGGFYLTREAKAYKRAVEVTTGGLKSWCIDKGHVAVCVAIYRGNDANGKLRRGDLDGYLKVMLDCLQGIAYRNDSQIRHLCAELYEDRQNPRCEVLVRPWANGAAGLSDKRATAPPRRPVAVPSLYKPAQE